MGMGPLQEQRIKCWNRQVVLTDFNCKNKASSGLDNFITETQQELDPIEINLFSQLKSGYQKTFQQCSSVLSQCPTVSFDLVNSLRQRNKTKIKTYFSLIYGSLCRQRGSSHIQVFIEQESSQGAITWPIVSSDNRPFDLFVRLIRQIVAHLPDNLQQIVSYLPD